MTDADDENKSLRPICDCDLCSNPMPACDCEICKECRDEALAMIGLNGIDDDELRFVIAEVEP